MEIEKYKILETDFNGKGVSAQPNPMQKTEEEAKAVFDELVKDVVTPKHNDLVEALKPIDLTSDKDKPVSDAQKEALDKKVDKELRTGSTEKYKVLSDNNYSDEERDRVYNTLAKDNDEPFDPTGEYHPATKKYVDDKVLESGNADMVQAVYDPKGEKKDMFAHERLKDNPHGVTVAQVGGCNPNLLDNWYFGNPVDQKNGYVVPPNTPYFHVSATEWNQAGTTTQYYLVNGSTVSGMPTFDIEGTTYMVGTVGTVRGYVGRGMTIDRFFCENDTGAVVVNDDGTVTFSASAAGDAVFIQTFEKAFAKNFYGKEVTLSALTADGQLKSVTGSFGTDQQNTVFFETLNLSGGSITAAFFPSGNSYQFFRLIVARENSVTLKAVKMENGSEQTLAHQKNGNWVLNEIPNYAEQMAICKQYDPNTGEYKGVFNPIDGYYNGNDWWMSNGSGRVQAWDGGIAMDALKDRFVTRLQSVCNGEGFMPYVGIAAFDGAQWIAYQLYGEHNKPSGTYTGTNSNTEYAIYTGGVGNLLFISSAYAFGWVMPSGAVFFRGSSSSANHFSSGIKYENGVLTISNSSAYFNSNNYEYTWQCV